MRGTVQAFHRAVQRLRRRPGATLAVASILALGVGVLTAVVHLRRAVLRPLPYPHAEELVHALAESPRDPGRPVPVAPADVVAWRDGARSFTALGAYQPFGPAVAMLDERPERLSRASVSEGLAAALALEPLAGRWFSAAEYRSEARVLLLGERLWRTRFGARRDAVGGRLRMNGEAYTIVGVLPRRFRIPGVDPDVVTPLIFAADAATDRRSSYLGVIARLRPGATRAGAAAELDELLRRTDRALGEPDASRKRASLRDLHDSFSDRLRPALRLLLGAAAFVALVAAANAGTLLVGDAARRRREWAIVHALGGSATELRRQAFAEALLSGALAAVLGLLAARLFLALLPDPRGAYLARNVELGLDLGSAFAAAGAALLLTLLAYLPRLLARAPLGDSLRIGRAETADRQGRRTLTAVGAVQAALAAVVLSTALALVAGLTQARDAQAALGADDVLAFDLELTATAYPGLPEIEAFDERATTALRALPGVASAAMVRALAPERPWGFRPGLEGIPEAETPSLGWQVVTPEAFHTLHTGVLAGRALTPADREGAERAVVLNRSAAARLAALGRGIGDPLRFNGESYRIVGIVEDGPEAPEGSNDGATVFLPLAQRPVPAGYLREVSFVLRAVAGARPGASDVREAIRRLDRELPVGRLEPLPARLASSIAFAQIRLDAALGASFALLALIFVIASLSAALILLVQQRRREFAVRMALGASPRRIATGVLAHAASMVVAGTAAGILLVRTAAPLLAAHVAGLGPLGHLRALLVGAILVATALAAAALPALRASRTDPAATLAGL